MDHYFLNREPSTPQGTLGDICDEKGLVFCDTCELPWLDNEPDKSCIPPGTYTVIRHNSLTHPNVWEITGVPNRSGILIHNGNTEKDSLGCIIVGTGTGIVNGLPAVMLSRITLAKLQRQWPSTFLLTVE